jgi:hypothetical protein
MNRVCSHMIPVMLHSAIDGFESSAVVLDVTDWEPAFSDRTLQAPRIERSIANGFHRLPSPDSSGTEGDAKWANRRRSAIMTCH